MINIEFNKLNVFEQKIMNSLTKLAKANPNLKITEAANACECSTSKISKSINKMGFDNYKQYINFVNNKITVKKQTSSELDRIKDFIEKFNQSTVDTFIDLINSTEKIILYGYGPSFICAQYFEYKLRIFTNKFVIAVHDEVSLRNLVDKNSLVIIFSTTGKFKSFSPIIDLCKDNNSELLYVIEEFNSSPNTDYGKVIFLSDTNQSEALEPYEKSRITFFILIEEVLSKLLMENKKRFRI